MAFFALEIKRMNSFKYYENSYFSLICIHFYTKMSFSRFPYQKFRNFIPEFVGCCRNSVRQTNTRTQSDALKILNSCSQWFKTGRYQVSTCFFRFWPIAILSAHYSVYGKVIDEQLHLLNHSSKLLRQHGSAKKYSVTLQVKNIGKHCVLWILDSETCTTWLHIHLVSSMTGQGMSASYLYESFIFYTTVRPPCYCSSSWPDSNWMNLFIFIILCYFYSVRWKKQFSQFLDMSISHPMIYISYSYILLEIA